MRFVDIFLGRHTVLESIDGRVACRRAGPFGVDVEVCHGCADVVDIQKLQNHYRVSCRRGPSDPHALASTPCAQR